MSRSGTPKLFEKSMILRATAEFWSSAAVGDGARFEMPTLHRHIIGHGIVARPMIRTFPSRAP